LKSCSAVTADNEKYFRELLSELDFDVYASLLSREGDCLVERKGLKEMPVDIPKIIDAFRKLVSAYPKKGLQRLFIENKEGTAVLLRLPPKGFLFLQARKEIPLCTVALHVTRLVAKLGRYET